MASEIAERQRHQDGRILFKHGSLKLDLRISFYSTVHGEKTVMRLLNNRSGLLLAELSIMLEDCFAAASVSGER